VKEELLLHREKLLLFHEEQALEKKQQEFDAAVSNLHHLLSTNVRPGIYNSPFAHTRPTVFGIAVEDHLRSLNKKDRAETLRAAIRVSESQRAQRTLRPVQAHV
jgi:hypothetical protein